MLFLLLCKSGENKEVPNIQSINQSINGEHPPPRVLCVLPPDAGPGVFRTSGRRGRCLAGAPTPRISPGPQGGGHPLGKPLPPGFGRRLADPPRRAALCAAPGGRGAGPRRPHLLRDRCRGSPAARAGEGQGGGWGAGRWPRPALSATRSSPPGAPQPGAEFPNAARSAHLGA